MNDSRFTAAFWDQRHSGTARVWSGRPTPALIEQAAVLAPGTALDVGCGEGTDAIWLAEQGWEVTGVDFSAQALRLAEAHTPQDLTDRLIWHQADVRTWPAEPEGHSAGYDLVAASYLHFPAALRREVFAALAARVGPVLPRGRPRR